METTETAGVACGGPTSQVLLERTALPDFVAGVVTLFGSRQAGRPPRLLVRTLLVTFGTVLAILLAVFVVLLLELRSRVNAEVADNLETGRLVLAELEQRRLADLQVRVAELERNPTLESAVQKYKNVFGGFSGLQIKQSMTWLEGQLQTLADAAGADVAAAVDGRHQTMAAAGRLGRQWPWQTGLGGPADGVRVQTESIAIDRDCYRVITLPLHVNRERVGTLYIGRRMDDRFASSVSTLTRAETVVSGCGTLRGTTLPLPVASAFAVGLRAPLEERGQVTAGGETFAYQRMESLNHAAIYGLASVTRPVSMTTSKAFRALGFVGLGAFVLAVLGSLFLTHTVAGPIDAISRSLSAAVSSKDLGIRLESDGSSREIEVLTATFNDLMCSLARAENERRAAYLEAIQALAKALEARDVYTAGHSQRVRDLSVAIARRMGMPEEQIEVLKLGASLHDIGKIGIGDRVLRKSGRLTKAERLAIEAHPVVGARILEPVAFLADHARIVELHHEQPDGRGYPHGFTGERIPISAHIVHLADAFDAMTSDRPYRAGCSTRDAIAEILRHRGTMFDEDAVEALLAVMSDEACREDARPVAEGARSQTALPRPRRLGTA